MAACTVPSHEEQIGGNGLLYARENRVLRWRIRDAEGVLVNIDGWTTQFIVSTTERATMPTIDVAGQIVGAYNPVEASNTQYVEVELTADHTNITAPRQYRYSLKRTDTGFEDILRAGPFVIELATQ
jgi:hypothetical protein